MKRIITILMLAATALAFTGIANAKSDQATSQGAQQQTQKLMSQYRQMAQKIGEIHKKTIKNNPQLAKEQKQFQEKVRKAIKDQGYDIEKGQNRMQQTAKKLKSGKLSKSERKDAMQNFQAERQKMVKARQAALNRPDVKKAGKKLQQDTLAAMKKQNSQTSELLNRMKALRAKLKANMPSSGNASHNG